jgi:hypothetical protein
MRNAYDSEERRRGGNGHEKLHGNDTLEEDSAPTFLTSLHKAELAYMICLSKSPV